MISSFGVLKNKMCTSRRRYWILTSDLYTHFHTHTHTYTDVHLHTMRTHICIYTISTGVVWGTCDDIPLWLTSSHLTVPALIHKQKFCKNLSFTTSQPSYSQHPQYSYPHFQPLYNLFTRSRGRELLEEIKHSSAVRTPLTNRFQNISPFGCALVL